MSARICEHLEAQLPQMRDGDPPQYLESATVGAHFTMSIYDVRYPKFSEPEFRNLLQMYGIVDEWDQELLVGAYVYREHQESMAKDAGLSQPMISRRLSMLRALLVERGFEQELE